MRLSEWPRNPYLNDELREWISLHLDALGGRDVAIYAVPSGREDDQRRVLVATEVGLLDGWYAPRGSTARYSLSVRLYPWQTVHGVDLRGETFRLWAHEHESRWRLRIARPSFDAVADTPELGRAMAQFAAACAVMAEPAGEGSDDRSELPALSPEAGPGPSMPAAPAIENGGESGAQVTRRPPIRIEPDLEMEPPLDLERRLGLR